MSDKQAADDEREVLIEQIMADFDVDRPQAIAMADITLGRSRGDVVDVPEGKANA